MDRDVLLLTGAPGSGKTTLVRRVADALPPGSASGFYTEEVRERGGRVGFRLVPLGGGAPRMMAHVRGAGRRRVGRYRVDVAAIDAAVAECLAPEAAAPLAIVDEIGKMECFSAAFVEAVRERLEGGRPLLATVALRGGGFIAEAKRLAGADPIEVTPESRDRLVDSLVEWARRRAAP